MSNEETESCNCFQETLPVKYRWDNDNSGHTLTIGSIYWTRVRARNLVGESMLEHCNANGSLVPCIRWFFSWPKSLLATNRVWNNNRLFAVVSPVQDFVCYTALQAVKRTSICFQASYGPKTSPHQPLVAPTALDIFYRVSCAD